MKQEAKAVTLALAIMAGLHLDAAQGETKAASRDLPVFVRTGIAEQGPRSHTLNFIGHVAPVRSVDLSFEVSGELVEINVPMSTWSEAGDILATLDPAPFEVTLRKARDHFRAAERAYRRARAMAKSGMGSERGAQDALLARNTTKTLLDKAEDALGRTRIVAPFSGYVINISDAPKETVAPDAPLFRLYDMSRIRIEIDMPADLLADNGEAETMGFSALLPEPGGPIELQLRDVTALDDRVSRLTFSASGASHPPLRPGQPIAVAVQRSMPQETVAIPASAIVDQDGASAAVMFLSRQADGQNVILRRAVEIHAHHGNTVTVSGLPRAAEIVTFGGRYMAEGQSVSHPESKAAAKR
ncbi:efflux RND transporter periplasmic adaptor subunit [Thalassococcus sp. S3]|uniref:efflux RND transporter periplasmic adaptor subunit n=1 Tax=Thalassococcus sp. S3 TaxID=2017482 RepID=UPI0013EEAD5D|nr:efflux RND transporter periplasmic adaptor subunit [Thalassococcus sp. S3]